MLGLPIALLSTAVTTVGIVHGGRVSVIINFNNCIATPNKVTTHLAGAPLVVRRRGTVTNVDGHCLTGVTAGMLRTFRGAFTGDRLSTGLRAINGPIHGTVAKITRPARHCSIASDSPLGLLIMNNSLNTRILGRVMPGTLTLVSHPFRIHRRYNHGGSTTARATCSDRGLDTRRFAMRPFVSSVTTTCG